MNSLRILLTAVLLVVWPVAVMHCHLETLPGFDFIRCAADTDTSSDCEGDGCKTVEEAAYKAPDNQQIAPQFFLSPLLISGLLSGEDTIRDPLKARLYALPPELSTSWQFFSRAAPPVRAPSFSS